MLVHLKKITLTEVTAGREQDALPESRSWRVFSVAKDCSFEHCEIYAQIEGLSSKEDQRSALSALTKLLKVAHTGDPLEVHYDKKQCHELFRFHYKGKERTVWRLRNASVRIPFYYAKGKILFLPGIVVKRRDKLKKYEESALAKEVERLIDAEESETLVIQADTQ